MTTFPAIRFSKSAKSTCKRPFFRSVFAKLPGMSLFPVVRVYLKTVKKTELDWSHGSHGSYNVSPTVFRLPEKNLSKIYSMLSATFRRPSGSPFSFRHCPTWPALRMHVQSFVPQGMKLSFS